MAKQPGDKERGSIEGGGQENERPLSVEDLKKRRADLEARVAQAKRQKEEDLGKQLKDREVMVAEDTRLVPLLEEARSTLEYFEVQNQQGLLTEAGDLKELDSLKQLVVSLEQQRAYAWQKYDAIMAQPEVYAKVREDADQEGKDRDFKEREQAATKEIQERTDKFSEKIVALAQEKENAWNTVQARERDVNTAKSALYEIRKKAKEGLSSAEFRTNNVIDDTSSVNTHAEYIRRLEDYRKGLGMFKGKEKAAIDYVLRERQKFLAVDQLVAGERGLNQARKDMEEMDARIDQLAEEYKTLLMEAWAKENELTGGAYRGDTLPDKVHYGVEHNLKKVAGIGETESRNMSYGWKKEIYDKAKEKNFGAFIDTFREVEKKAGEYLWMTNPEKKA